MDGLLSTTTKRPEHDATVTQITHDHKHNMKRCNTREQTCLNPSKRIKLLNIRCT